MQRVISRMTMNMPSVRFISISPPGDLHRSPRDERIELAGGDAPVDDREDPRQQIVERDQRESQIDRAGDLHAHQVFGETGEYGQADITDYENDRHRHQILQLPGDQLLDRGVRSLKRCPVASHDSPPAFLSSNRVLPPLGLDYAMRGRRGAICVPHCSGLASPWASLFAKRLLRLYGRCLKWQNE